MGRVGVILLAAGQSRRMGELKALLPWRDTTLLNYQVSILHRANLTPIVVVLGHGATKLEAQLKGVPEVQLVFNPTYRHGKTTSIKAGLEVISRFDLDAILVANVDQPRSLETITAIVSDYSHNTPLITIPTYRSKRGHPVVFSVDLIDEIRSISEDDQGLKAITRGHINDIRYVEMNNPDVLLDLNTEEEYTRAAKGIDTGRLCEL